MDENTSTSKDALQSVPTSVSPKSTNPKLNALVDDIELDTATRAFFAGIRYTVLFIVFLCALILVDVLLITLPVEICWNYSNGNCGLSFKTRALATSDFAIVKQIIDIAQEVVFWVFSALVLSYIFKGKGGSQFFEALGNLIEKFTGFYKAKAQSKVGTVGNDINVATKKDTKEEMSP